MSRHMMLSELPSWAQYVVAVWGPTGVIAPCSTIEAVVDCLVRHRLTFRCEVIRVNGDVMVWPFHVKGGSA